MIRINRLTDYAVVVLAEMSRGSDVRTVSRISADTGVPLPTVAKLMKALAHGGLVVSHRGAAGGYSLNRNAAAISVADIIEAVEGPIAITACVDDADDQCGIEQLCPMHGHWSRINQAIRRSLDGISLAEIAAMPVFEPVAAGQPI
ncbi:MAG: SUF system Fe-S cluster assembly regulator [Alphaproteobacteria bacterium]|nr:SUF system Fe-S cluster assembly regulator [Alphaproteobacteria bacterium]MBF0129181.1 SUF system Fe-S cluster assembly regulator [Alphaproteobacteria bacterium]